MRQILYFIFPVERYSQLTVEFFTYMHYASPEPIGSILKVAAYA